MASSDTEVLVVGAGAAGMAAGRRLMDAHVDCLVVEARSRLGGRAWTMRGNSEFPIDLGCGWLHSADRNPWREIAEAQGGSIDKTPPPWTRPSLELGFPRADQDDFRQALGEFYARLEDAAHGETDIAAASLLDPSCRWNGLINAISTYINGVELDQLSARDFWRYRDTGINWRVVEGYGSLIAASGAGLDVTLDCPAQVIDHGGRLIRIETPRGELLARAVVVTVPTDVLVAGSTVFHSKDRKTTIHTLKYSD